MKKKVLLIVNTGLVNGGVPKVIMETVSSSSDVITYDLLCGVKNRCYYDEEFLSYGGKIFNLDIEKYKKSKFFFFMKGVILYKFLNKHLKLNKYDSVHCHNGIDSGFCIKSSYENGINSRISHCHGNYKRKGKNIFLRFYNFCGKYFISKYSNYRLTCSEEVSSTLFGEKMHTHNVLNPVDTNFYFKIKKTPRKSNVVNLLQIGYFCENKNQMFSLELLNSLIQQKYDASLNFIGYEDGNEYTDRILKYINENNLNKFVTFLDQSYPKEKIFPEIDYVLLPSYSEACPMVLLEAQASNIQCLVSTNVPKDVDLGLCNYFSINTKDKWINFITTNKSAEKLLKKENLDIVDRKSYASKIVKAYNNML